VLQDCGVIPKNILIAENGAQAIDLMAENPDISFLLTDYNMHGMNGFEVSHLAKKMLPAAYIILMTAEINQDRAFKEKATQSGVDMIFNKIGSVDLFTVLQKLGVGKKT
jgi:CheY-like chemotaxis protein